MRKILLMVDRLDKIDLFFLTDLLRKTVHYVKVNGFGACLKQVLLSLGEVFVKHREVVLFEKGLSEIPELIYLKREMKIEIGRQHDVGRLTQLLPQCSARIFLDRLLRGDIFFIARIGHQIVHQTWVSFRDNHAPLLNKRIVLREGEAYFYHVYTAPEFRGKHIFAAVITRVLRYLRAQGYKRIFFLVDLKAHQIRKAYERIIGPDKGAIISYWRILGYRSYHYEPYGGVK